MRAATALGAGDIAPTIAAATLLGHMADAAKTPEDAAALRARADAKLTTIAAAATSDAGIAIALGVA